jgi:hypothetical protein
MFPLELLSLVRQILHLVFLNTFFSKVIKMLHSEGHRNV